MRDRLGDLAKAKKAPADDDDEDVEMGGFSGGGDAQLNKFFQQVQEIREHIENIEQNTKRIEALYTASLGAAMEDQVTRGNREAENLVFDTNKIATTVKNKLRAMKTEIQQYDKEDEENKGGVSVEGRLRASQHSALSKKFVDIMAEYQDVQAKCKTKFKQRMERQYRIVQPDATQEQVDSALEGNQAGGAIFSAQFLAASQRAEAKKALKDIQERHVEILKLEESLRELHQLFLDMQLLVEAQGQMLNEIEKSVDKAVDYTEKGVSEMKKAVKYQKKSRKKMFILICCLIVLVIVILVPTLVTQIPKN